VILFLQDNHVAFLNEKLSSIRHHRSSEYLWCLCNKISPYYGDSQSK
jgi:hypothetical protein